ncbi:uncharacterized protein N7459_001480 [Penicillium hispanicum]|uniref:uncharacterized protein n=1 Tax=Penicillium hispanicum TaxID=1080232 RepID=UPI00253F9C8D|nr:uncharacterized protein N7459_001480 [Penicillium hispanicum]KAJ5595272.1 hypothetical protein N7459_001480 [Penicillium hispanicum]
MDGGQTPEGGQDVVSTDMRCDEGPGPREQSPPLMQDGQCQDTQATNENEAVMPVSDENPPNDRDQPVAGLSVGKEQLQANITPDADEDTRPVHSAFGKHQKRFIVLMVTMASFFSPLSGQIYYPVMPTLVQNYHLTNALVNLTITTYMILQGLAPSFMGTFADTGGRRPAYIIAFAIYTAANIGLALQNSFAALLVLRCIQSAGSSGTVSFGYGVIADIATPAERGKYIGPMAAGVMVAPALGPVIGGLLAKFLGWRSVFWFLVIISGGYLVLFMIAMPETARKIVGNGSLPPKEWWRMSLLQYLSAYRSSNAILVGQEGHTSTGQAESSQGHAHGSTKLKFPNPFESFVILLEKDALIIILYVGLVIPLGISACLSAVLNGKAIDYNYTRTAQKLGLPVDRKKGDDLRAYPIERTRLQTVFPVMALGIAAFIPYGWTLQQHAHLAAPLVLQFIIGFCFIASLNTLNTLLVDLFPDRPATAAAACNLVRCWLGAIGAAVIDQMLNGMGWGWCFAFLGLLMGAAMGLLWMESVYGMGWREKRLAKIEREKRQKEERADVEVAAKSEEQTKDEVDGDQDIRPETEIEVRS